jgi:hypothetical protein
MENLLSKASKEEIKIGYRRRLTIVWCWLVVAAFPVFLALVTPVYIAGGMRLSEIKERNTINESAAAGNTQVFELPTLINKKSEAVIAYKSRESVSDMASSIFSAAPEGVRIEEVSFQQLEGKKGDEFRVSGVAKNRETLTFYEKEVKKLDFIESVNVPVESFSKPVDLRFYMNISIGGAQE